MSDFVYSGAEWYCAFGGKGTLQAKQQKVKIEEKGSMLTNKDKPRPVATGVCSALSGVPCSPQCGPWQKVSKTVDCSGHKALLSDSCVICFKGGGLITLKNKPTTVKYAGSSFSLPKRIQKTYENRVKQKNNFPKPAVCKASEFHLSVDNSIVKNHMAQSIKNDQKITDVPVKTTGQKSRIPNQLEPSIIPPATPAILRQKHWCSGDCPEEYKNNCKFCSAPSQLRYKNAGEKLKANLKREHDTLYRSAANIARAHYFSLAHHHLIPGNECYGKMNGNHRRYELLLKLGYFFDYNVNAEENGIILPSPSHSPETSEALPKIKITKAEYYYKIMDDMEANLQNNPALTRLPPYEHDFVGSQLHAGQHIYVYNLKILQGHYPEAYKLRSYETLVIAELDRLSNFYTDNYENTCYMKDYKKNKKEFFLRMDSLSSRLRKGITQFPERKKEFSILKKGVYVSFPAILYGMNISLDEYQRIFPPSKEEWKFTKNQNIRNKILKHKEARSCGNTICSSRKIQKFQTTSISMKRRSRIC